ncbi:unnamed protein product [Allacma fusca]|uniref:Peptidase S1 domain-containing protein n=1 Tax=Allacma fusca TaxID=39272 RepID=A0A8J2L1G9_9HEXA|nr:unnamed protein product [Allacma fusca]
MENKNLDGSKVTASGWGVTKHGANDSGETLRKVVMDVIPNPTCNKQYPSQKIKDSMMCTLTRNKDTCQGDSGSGIDYFARQSQTQCVVGIVSFGTGCADPNIGGVYTRVTSYLGWIQSQTGADYCKNCNP